MQQKKYFFQDEGSMTVLTKHLFKAILKNINEAIPEY